jgi:hypothetical protein
VNRSKRDRLSHWWTTGPVRPANGDGAGALRITAPAARVVMVSYDRAKSRGRQHRPAVVEQCNDTTVENDGVTDSIALCYPELR